MRELATTPAVAERQHEPSFLKNNWGMKVTSRQVR